MKSKGHVYMANVMIECLKNPDAQVTFPEIESGNTYHVSPYVKNCILRYPSCFRAGSVGPDFFPDLVFGQMTIHSRMSGIWIDRMMDELKLLPANTQEREKAVSFFAGYMMHYAGDMFTHDYINGYARGWFPSYGEVIQNLFSYEINLEEAEKEYAELAKGLKELMPNGASEQYFKKEFSELRNALEAFFSVEEEKTILQSKYAELREILSEIFSKENAKSDLSVLSDDARTFLERLLDNPFTIDQLDDDLPKLKQAFESLCGSRNIDKLKKQFPELEKALREVFSFQEKRKRLEGAYAGLLEAMEDTFSSESKRNWIKKNQSQLWDKLKAITNKYLLEKRLKGIEQAKIIIRHVLVEKYMDDYIDEQVEIAKRNEERTLEIPSDYVRRCFASEDAFALLEKSGKEHQKEDVISLLGFEIRPSKIGDTGFLENYVKYYSQLYEGEGTSDQNLKDCNQRINDWLTIWKNIAEYSLQMGTFKAFDLYGKDLLYHVIAFFTEQEDVRRRLLNTIQGFDTFMGILDCEIPIISKLTNLIKEAVTNYLKRKFYPQVLDPAAYLSGKPKEELTTFDKAVSAVKERLKDVKPLLESTALFGDPGHVYKSESIPDDEIVFEVTRNPLLAIFGDAILKPLDQEHTGLSARLRKEWDNLGATLQLKEIRFSPFQNACRMGYLCLMEPKALNRLLRTYDQTFHLFEETKTSIGIGGFTVSLKTPEKRYAKNISSIWLGLFGIDGLFMQFQVCLTENCFFEEGEIRIPIPAKRTIPLEKIKQFEIQFHSAGPGVRTDNVKKLESPINCAVYDGVTNLLLASGTALENYIDLSPEESLIKEDVTDITHKAKIRHLRVEIKTGDNGTDGTVHFVTAGVNGTIQNNSLDKGGYNDFEAGDLDSYEIKLNVPLSIDEISHFEIYKDGGGDWKMEYVNVFSLESGDYLAGLKAGTYVTDAPLMILKAPKWISSEEKWHAPIQPDEQLINELVISIKTSGDMFSGTDDDITLYVHYLDASGRDTTEFTELNTSMHNDFEADDVDTFQWRLQGPVPLEHFLFFEVKKKGKDDWVVEWIRIRDAQTGVLLGAVDGRFELVSEEDYVRINVR